MNFEQCMFCMQPSRRKDKITVNDLSAFSVSSTELCDDGKLISSTIARV